MRGSPKPSDLCEVMSRTEFRSSTFQKRTTGMRGIHFALVCGPREARPHVHIRLHTYTHKSKRYIDQKMLGHTRSRSLLRIPSAIGIETLWRCRIRLRTRSRQSSSTNKGARASGTRRTFCPRRWPVSRLSRSIIISSHVSML